MYVKAVNCLIVSNIIRLANIMPKGIMLVLVLPCPSVTLRLPLHHRSSIERRNFKFHRMIKIIEDMIPQEPHVPKSLNF